MKSAMCTSDYTKNLVFTQWNRVLLEKPLVAQLIKNFPIICGFRVLITVITRALHLSLSWGRSVQSIPPHPISLRYILILSSHLGLGLFLVVYFLLTFPTKILYAFIFYPSVLRVLILSCSLTWSFNYTRRTLQATNLLILQFSPTTTSLIGVIQGRVSKEVTHGYKT
jgi:hypothetical protein